MIDVRYASALQLMLTLALAEREGAGLLSSIELAEGLATNPSLTRKLVVPLARAGLIATSMGAKGGARLGRPARDISLRDIYLAVLGEKNLFAARSDIPHRCVVSSNMESMFTALSSELEEAVLAVLGKRTLEGELAHLEELDSARPRAGKRAARTRT